MTQTSILRRALPCVALLLFLLPSLAPAQELDSEEKKTLYALGQLVAQNLGGFQLSAEDLKVVQLGIVDGVTGAEAKVEMETYGAKVQGLAQERASRAAETEKAAGAEFLAKKAAEEGAIRKESGLIIKEITPGTGASPAATDKVTVHYHGTLRDGTVFDSSVDRGQPATFGLNQVIRCWTEGVQLIKVGGKSQLTCPSDIAYGDRGRPGIPPGATLVFEVELLSIGEGQ
jgi:FKBP-type peptidyl-prolyl cis-trans isomerase FkpA/FKBP-type peptidyl-prolyl cis-trans isomerase FklB